ncbi:glycosyl transferase family protein [Candidatus Moduliflexus flocculans]|uniref:Glycosyl transferase family protein n=1 Tax=Candidatus Moduliflexus flocculans TaxID=1499966 RepID=A0A0S6VSV0_9BACT|nr:glycosyl transferase family protein [Candidatus Moduliflexus flocculans]
MCYHKRLISISILLVILLGGLYYRILNFSHDIDGHHIFRQTHVASNIYYFLKDGISISPKMFTQNQTYKIFDFPLYQMIIAILCTALDSQIVMTARACNLLIYCFTYVTLYGIMVHCKTNKRVIFFTLFFYSISPLNVFYNRAIIPDNLGIFLGFQSLFYFLLWDKKTIISWYYVAMVGTGILTTLIKNPIYLPIMCTIFLWFIFHHHIRVFYSLRVGLFVFSIGVTVVFYKLFSNYINIHSFKTPSWEFAWYFSTLPQRFQTITYMAIINRFFFEVVFPPVFMLFIIGFPLYLLNYRNYLKKQEEFVVMLGLQGGSLLTILLFLNVNRIHNYYQMPYVFITCFFSAYGINVVFTQINKLIMSYNFSTKLIIKAMLMTVFIVFFLHTVRFSLFTNKEPHDMIEAGNFIHTNTPAEAFIFYVKTDDWDPSFLYYAKREGYNVGIEQLSESFLQDKIEEYTKFYRQFYLYLPNTFFSQGKDILENYNSHNVQCSPQDGCLMKL